MIVLKVLLLSAVVLLLLILLVTAWVLQPTFRRSQRQLSVRGNPVRLRQDVAALTSIPGGRSYLNGNGLAIAAAYIRTNLAESGARPSLNRSITSEQQPTPMSSLASVPKRETGSSSVRTTIPSPEHQVLMTMQVVWQACSNSRAPLVVAFHKPELI